MLATVNHLEIMFLHWCHSVTHCHRRKCHSGSWRPGTESVNIRGESNSTHFHTFFCSFFRKRSHSGLWNWKHRPWTTFNFYPSSSARRERIFVENSKASGNCWSNWKTFMWCEASKMSRSHFEHQDKTRPVARYKQKTHISLLMKSQNGQTSKKSVYQNSFILHYLSQLVTHSNHWTITGLYSLVGASPILAKSEWSKELQSLSRFKRQTSHENAWERQSGRSFNTFKQHRLLNMHTLQCIAGWRQACSKAMSEGTPFFLDELEKSHLCANKSHYNAYPPRS